jgi:ABC-type branched-subunit amino acid transport system ATPase component
MTIIRSVDMTAGYGGQPVIRHINIEVSAGEVVAVLGPNGAGKTTTLKALSGSLPLLGGTVEWKGKPSTAPLNARCRDGLAYVTEERCIFYQLTTRQNLKVGGVSTASVLELFPELGRCLNTRAGQMSGGEQQMLALARALARQPDLLLVDELSIGLAPLMVERLLEAVRAAADRGLAVLLVEQFVEGALSVANRVYVLRNGDVSLSGTAAEMRANRDRMRAAYLGGNTGDTSVAVTTGRTGA